MSWKTATAGILIATALFTGCGRTEKVRDIASPDYWLENYRYFKQQKSAIEQVNSTIQNQRAAIDHYKADFAGTPRMAWPRDARQTLDEKEFALDGYIRQYNVLVADYNYKANDITRKLADTPLELRIAYKDSVDKYVQYSFAIVK